MIYYIGYYSCDIIHDENRKTTAAAENKMNYIMSALCSASDEKIKVVSLAETRSKKFILGKECVLNDRISLKTFSSKYSKSRIIRGFFHIYSQLCAFLYLTRNINAGDKVIVYHSTFSMKLISVLKRVKNIELIIEVEELYADVINNEKKRKQEIKYLNLADKYIFITKLLRNEVNNRKPFIISHGTYQSIPDYGFRFCDDKIHIVYAGTFSKTKGGAYNAVSIAEFLDDKYAIDILGFGSQHEENLIKETIRSVSEKTKCKVNFIGMKTGVDFNSYIQACHIGLSTQQGEASFNLTSFPSKILMYLANGLKVVSVRIPAVEYSQIGKFVNFYDNSNNIEEIADVIKSIDIKDKFDSRAQLDSLNDDFICQLRSFLS